MSACKCAAGAKSADKPQQYEIKSLFLHKLQSLGFVVQWIEQPSPKGLIGVRFPSGLLSSHTSPARRTPHRCAARFFTPTDRAPRACRRARAAASPNWLFRPTNARMRRAHQPLFEKGLHLFTHPTQFTESQSVRGEDFVPVCFTSDDGTAVLPTRKNAQLSALYFSTSRRAFNPSVSEAASVKTFRQNPSPTTQ